MKIKSLLLGSAAAMVAVSSAQAADAVVVEAEPVEYVRVCDAYGSGFFFIPGTETCIRFGGFVRSSYEKYTIDGTATVDATAGNAGPNGLDGDADDVAPTVQEDNVSFDNEFVLWGQRARLDIDTRNETDWGTLRATYRLEGGQSNVDTDIDMDIALIQLAGFRAGFAGANYWSTNHGFGNVASESVSSVASGAIYTDGYYGFDDATIFDYTFAADGLSITVGVEDPRISYGQSNEDPGALTGEELFDGGFLNGTNDGGEGDANANFYAGLNYSADFGTFAATIVRDSTAVDQNDGDIGGWAYKVSLSLDLSEFIPGGSISGYYLDDGDYDTDYLHTGRTTFNPGRIWGVAVNANLTDDAVIWANYWDVSGTDIEAGGLVGAAANAITGTAFAASHTGADTGDLDQFAIGVRWSPSAAPGFTIDASYYTGDIEGAISPLGNTSGLTNVNADFDGFEVTLRRNF